VRRGIRVLPVVLTQEELAHVAMEAAKLVPAVDDAENEVESIKAEAKERIEGAKNRAIKARQSLAEKSRVLREGRVDREVSVTTRVDWTSRRRTVTRDDTGDVVESGPASQEEMDALCTWVTEGVRRRLVAPDGTEVRVVLLPDAERQEALPLDDDQDDDQAPAATPGTTRVWVHGRVWRHLDHKDSDRLEKPDPKGPAVTWREHGAWFFADVPTVVLSQVEAHARKAEIVFFTQPTEPTLADLRAQTPEEPTRLNPKGRRGVLPPKE
jgi:hypothetical protein